MTQWHDSVYPVPAHAEHGGLSVREHFASLVMGNMLAAFHRGAVSTGDAISDARFRMVIIPVAAQRSVWAADALIAALNAKEET